MRQRSLLEGKVYYDKHPLYLIGPLHAFQSDDRVTIFPKRLKGESIEVIVHRENEWGDGVFDAYEPAYFDERFGDEVPF